MTMLRYPAVWWVAMVDRNKTIPEGAATTVLAAVAPLQGSKEAAAASGKAAGVVLTPGAYYADCREEVSRVHPTASDPAIAERLWRLSEDAVAKALSA